MSANPLDELMSSTVAVSTDEAEQRRPALPFAGTAVAAPPAPLPPSPPAHLPPWPSPPTYQAPAAMPTAMKEIWERGAGAASHVPPPPRTAEGGFTSAYGFSNAAAAPHDDPSARMSHAAIAVRAPRERVDYLWHDSGSLDAILATPSIQDEPTRADEEEWLPAPGSEEVATIRAVLRKRAPAQLDDLPRLYGNALDRGDHHLHCVLHADLHVSFDALEALRVTLALVTPYLADGRVKDAHDAARVALDASANMPAAIASHHKERIDEAVRAVARPAHATLEAVVERALLESRALSRRNVFGTNMVRARVAHSGVAGRTSAVPAYLDAAAAMRLPLMRCIPVRLVVDVRASQDAAENSPVALRVVALGRVVELEPRGR